MFSHDQIAKTTLSLLANRANNATICPSEVARYLQPEDWRTLMEPVRQCVRVLAEEGIVEITQRGEAVDPKNFKGPIRIKSKRIKRKTV